MRAQLARFGTTTIGQAIDAYADHLKAKGTIGYGETIRRLCLFFGDIELRISRITPERGKALYEKFRDRTVEHYKKDGTPAKDHGKPISVSYHRAALINARSFCTWTIEEHGWLRDNPFSKVKGIGKRKSGKHKPRGNELFTWFDYVWKRVEQGHESAIAVMLQLSLALRSSDLTRRLVRDVDMNGTQLIVEDGKTEESNEPRVIPEELRPHVQRLVAGRDLSEPLFKTTRTEDGHHDDHWLWQAQERFCRLAKVPRFCPHSLKGVSGTIVAKQGATGAIVMNHLSHRDQKTGRRHYVDGAVIEAAQAEQAFKVFAGGKK